MRNLKNLIEEKWMNVAEKFNNYAKRAGIPTRWGFTTIWKPFWWAGIYSTSYVITLFLTGEAFNFNFFVTRALVGFFAYCIGMCIQWIYVRFAKPKEV